MGNCIARNASGDEVKRFSDQNLGPAIKAGSVALSGTTGAAGGSQGHINIQPSLAISYCMALLGLYPVRP